MATIPSNVGDDAPVIGLIAHMDTSPDAPGEGVEPIVHRGYAGGPIELPKGGTVVDPSTLDRAGHDIVTTSGDTLLGADDKSGVAAIMAAVARLAADPQLPRATRRICFTPDEEVGSGADLLDIEGFGARCAYTIDGSSLGELQHETVAGKEATIVVLGVEVHPGYATGVLVNAARIAGRILAALPADLTPEATSERSGFLHVYRVEATAGRAVITAIARDFDDDKLDAHVAKLRETAESVVADSPGATMEFDVVDQYPNMRRFIEPHPEIVGAAERAIEAEGIAVIRKPIRGGTDGSKLSARGLPTPNVFAGGHEFHSVREWVSVQDLAAAAAVIVRLAGEWGAETR
jgi:tripeptide aminopeptidase